LPNEDKERDHAQPSSKFRGRRLNSRIKPPDMSGSVMSVLDQAGVFGIDVVGFLFWFKIGC